VRNSADTDIARDDLTLGVLFSLREPKNIDWGVIRSAQMAHADRLIAVRGVSAILITAVTGFLIRDAVAPLALGVWLAASLILAGWSWHARVNRPMRGASNQARTPILLDAAMGAAFTCLWSAMLYYCAPGLPPGTAIGLWIVVATFMCGQIVLLAALPATTFLALLISGLGASAMLLRLDNLVAAGLSTIFTGVSLAAALQLGRDFICFRTTETTLVDRQETVSLLLREYEESASDWLWQIDASRRLVQVSPRFAETFGKKPAELNGVPLLQVLAGDKWDTGDLPEALNELVGKIHRRESFSNLLVPIQIGGDLLWWELSASPRRNENGQFTGFRGVGSDVTQQQASAAKIDRLARYDVLTGLPNRLQLNEALGRAIENSTKWRTRCAFLMIDLDRFKAVNDTLGHQVGDSLLAKVAGRLHSLMDANSMCGRLGGDEFGVLIYEIEDRTTIDALAKKIIHTLSQPYQIDHHTLYIGASIGSAIGLRDGRSIELLTRSADLALYRSKDQGGGVHYGYEPSLHARAEERRVMELALRKALERGEFHLNYQPVVRATDGVIEGFEALLRWTNKDLGPVSPAKFIPIAEDTRLIGAIGEWVLRTACHQAMLWPDHVRIAVNVSAEQLFQPTFVGSVVSALSHSGLPPARLELEVTESVFINDFGVCTTTLEQLLALGISLSLDDFGTGYSSLGYLRKTQFSTIKIDRSFVQGAARQAPESLAIIRAVVALADALGMSTTAEGAETEAEVAMICELGCKKIQGFYFGRPMPGDDATELFAQHLPGAETQILRETG